MSASSADPNMVEIGMTFINNELGVVHIEDHIWDLEEGETFVGIAIVTTTPKKQKKTKLLKCKK